VNVDGSCQLFVICILIDDYVLNLLLIVLIIFYRFASTFLFPLKVYSVVKCHGSCGMFPLWTTKSFSLKYVLCILISYPSQMFHSTVKVMLMVRTTRVRFVIPSTRMYFLPGMTRDGTATKLFLPGPFPLKE
jgi:hypothetical protein